MIVLETRSWQEIREKTPLVHDGGQFLCWMIKRLSIPRDRWIHTYVFEGNIEHIPSKVWERKKFLEPHIEALKDFMVSNKPCSVVGMGKLASECLTKGSVLKKRVGTYWGVKPRFMEAGVKHAWITNVPDAGLYDPSLLVDITRILGKAAREAQIDIKIDYQLPMYRNWHHYWQSGL